MSSPTASLIVFPLVWNQEWVQRNLEAIRQITLAFEEHFSSVVYDPQLGRTINIRTDLAEIEAAWRDYTARKVG